MPLAASLHGWHCLVLPCPAQCSIASGSISVALSWPLGPPRTGITILPNGPHHPSQNQVSCAASTITLRQATFSAASPLHIRLPAGHTPSAWLPATSRPYPTRFKSRVSNGNTPAALCFDPPPPDCLGPPLAPQAPPSSSALLLHAGGRSPKTPGPPWRPDAFCSLYVVLFCTLSFPSPALVATY